MASLSKQRLIPGSFGSAIALDDTEVAAFHAVTYILQTHKRLTPADVEWAANYISSFYAHGFLIGGQESGKTSQNQLVMFLVYADQTGICKFALTFNEELDTAIKNRNHVLLKSIVTGPREMFIELYDNIFLSAEDREFIIRLVSREIFAMNLTLELLKRKILRHEPIDTRCLSETTLVSGDNNHLTTLTSRCYDEVCLQDAKILEDDLIRAAMSRYEKAPASVYTVDKPRNASTPQAFCFDTLELIAAMIEEIPINPRTNQPFSEYAVRIIYQRFHKEIEMYRRYKQIKQLTMA